MITWHAKWHKDGNAWRVAILTIGEPCPGDEAVVVNSKGDVTHVILDHLCRFYEHPWSDGYHEWIYTWQPSSDVRHTNTRTNDLQSLRSVIITHMNNYTQ